VCGLGLSFRCLSRFFHTAEDTRTHTHTTHTQYTRTHARTHARTIAVSNRLTHGPLSPRHPSFSLSLSHLLDGLAGERVEEIIGRQQTLASPPGVSLEDTPRICACVRGDGA